MKIISHIGALDELDHRGYLRKVREYMGTSAGAFIALCKVIGYTQKEMHNIVLKFDFDLLLSPEVDNMFDFLKKFGVDDGVAGRRFIESCLRVKGFSAAITFRELVAKTGIRFRCFASDLTTMDIREFSATVTPDESVVTAIHASSAVPFYFTPVRHIATGHLLVDGGVVNNTPLKYLTEEEQVETLVITFHDSVLDSFNEESIAEYFQHIFACFYIQRIRHINMMRENICYLHAGDTGLFDTGMKVEQRVDLIKEARQDMKDYIDRTLEFIRRPLRRWSV